MRLFSLITFCVLSSIPAKAQLEGFHAGARFGIGESQLSASGYQEIQDKLHFSFGFISNYGFNEHLGIGVDILAGITRAKGFGEVVDNGGIFGSATYKFEDDLRFFDLNVPLLVKLSAGKGNFRPYLLGGPSLNFTLFATEKRTYADGNYHQAYGYDERELTNKENTHFSLVYGAGILIKALEKSGYFMEFRMNHPLTPAGRLNGQDYKLSFFSLNLGYYF